MDEAELNLHKVRAFWETVALGVTAPVARLSGQRYSPAEDAGIDGNSDFREISSSGALRQRSRSDSIDRSALDSDFGSRSSGIATVASKDITKATTSALRRMSIASGSRKKSVSRRKMVEELLVSEKTLENSGLLNPLGTRKLTWDSFIAILILYSTVLVPWNWAFGVEMNGDFQTLDFVVDLFFLVDIAITFNTAIVDHTTELLVLDRSEIVRRYLSFWFWIDLVASFPFDMVLRVSVFDKFTVFRVVRIIRTLRTLRVLKLLTDTSTMQRSKRLQSMNISVSVFHLLRFVLVVLLIAHILACAWIYIGQIGGSRGWISRSPFGSIEHYNELELYITAMYWVLVTMFSIGYGDFTPITELERSFTIGLQFVGGLTFGSILAEATRIVNTSNPHARVRNARMDQLRLYLMERNLPIKLKSDIKEAFEYYLNEKSVFDESRILSELPLSFRVKLVGHVFHKELSAFKYLFSRLHKGFVAQLLMNIKPYQCSIGDIIMHHGEVVTDIHFINKGVVRLSSKTFIKEAGVAKVEVIIGFSTDKGYFGDLEYFRKTNRFVDYIASAPCSCFSIDTSVIDDAGVSYVNCFGILTSEFESRSRAFMEAKKSEAVKVQSTWLRALFWDDGKLIDLKKNDAEDAGIGTAVDASGSPLTAAGHAAADNSTGESTSAMAGPSTKPIHRQQRSRRRSIVDVGEKTMYLSPLDKSPNGSEGSGSSTRVRMVKLSEDEPTIICDYQAKLDLLKRGIVLPQSKFKKGWDKFITFLLFISIVIIPLEVAYFPDSQALSNLMLVFDLIFCLDIIINFRVAYFDAEKVIIAIPKLIALKYFKTWLAFDLVTSFPYDAVVNSFSSSGRYITLVKAIRYFKMVKFFRITKLQKRETSIQEFIGADTVVFEVLKLLVQFVLLAHIVSCLYWIYCTSLSGEHWYDAYNLTDASPGDQYLVTLYFVVATLSTVGYGDIVAHTPFERLAVVCICFMAGSVMGYIVAKITAAMNTTNATERAVQERLLEVEGYLTAKNVSPGLKSLVLEQSFHKYTHASDDREEEILDILPNFLVMQIVSIHNAPDISAILLFRHIKNHSICLYIFRKLKSVYYSSGDVILSSGTVPSQVIFLVKGEVSVCKKERGIPTIAAHPNGTAPKSITSFDKAKSRLLEGKPDSSRRTDAANTNAQKSSLPVREGAATPSRHHRRGSTYQATEVTVANITAPGVLGLAAMIKGKLQDVSARAYAPCTSFNLEDSVILEILDHSPPLSLALRDAFAKLILDQRAEFKQKYRYKRFEFFSGHWSRATLARKKKQGIQSISRIKSFKSANASAQDLFVSFRSAIDAAHNWKSKSFSFRNSSLSDTENEKNPPSNSDRSAPKQPNRREGSRMTLSAPKFSTTCDLNGLSDPFENMDSQIESNRSPKRVTISPASPSRDRNTTSPSSANEDVFDVLSSPSPNRITRKPINTSALGLMTDRLSKVMPSELSSPGRILSRSSRNSKSNKVSVDSLEHITSEPTLSAESSAFSPRQMASEVQSPAADSSKLALTDASNSKNVSVSVNLNPALSIKLPSALDSQASPISSETSGSPRPSLSKKNVKLQRVKTLLLTAALEQKKKDDEAAAKSEGGSPRKNEAKNVAMRALNKKQFSFLAAQWKTLKPKYADLSRRQVGLYDSEAEDEYESVRVNSRWRSFVSGDSNQTLTTASSAVFTATSTAAELEPPDHSPSGDVPITSSSRVVLEPSRQLIFRARAMSNPFDAEVQYISGPSVKFLSNCPTGAALHPGLVSRHPLERLVHSKRRRRMSFPSADLRDWRELNTSEFMV